MRLNEYLKELRLRHNYSQRQLAIHAGLSNATISRIENDGITPDPETIIKLAAAFHMEAAELFKLLGSGDEGGSINVGDPEMLEVLEALKGRPEMQMLFSASKTATKEDIIRAAKFLEAMKK